MVIGEGFREVHSVMEPAAIERDENGVVLVDLLSSKKIGSRLKVACAVGCAYCDLK